MLMKKLKIVLFGQNGQIGSFLLKQVSQEHAYEVISFGRAEVDFENYRLIDDILRKYRPQVVINAVAFTNVEESEVKCDVVDKVNHLAAKQLALSSKAINALLIHFSSDFVFNGSKASPYLESDIPNPLNYYGQSKLNGDQAILEHSGKHIIFRCSWVYSYASNNFPNRLLQKSLFQEKLFVVDDTWGAPTSAFLIANVVCKILFQYYLSHNSNDFPSGIYNIAAHGKTTWFNFAKCLFDLLLKKKLLDAYPEILPISSESYHSNVQRPRNSVLDMSKILQEFEIDIPDWQTDLKEWVSGYTKSFKIKLLQE